MSVEKELRKLYFEIRCDKIRTSQLAYYAMEEKDECLVASYIGKIDCLSRYGGEIDRILRKHDVKLFKDANLLQRVWFKLTHIGR